MVKHFYDFGNEFLRLFVPFSRHKFLWLLSRKHHGYYGGIHGGSPVTLRADVSDIDRVARDRTTTLRKVISTIRAF